MIKTENAAIKQFLEENKSLTYLIPILIVLIIVAIVVLSKSGKSSKVSSEPPDWAGLENGNQVIILPQTTRNINDKESSVKKDPFESPFALTGIIFSEERPLAILESDNLSSIVGVGSLVGDSSWEVISIDKESVTISNGSDTNTLNISEKAK
ncbi:MAG: hypothetical protein GX184_03110 [Clostridiaceae bacterium]|nr:hypothetical protein [Clostridiaceae bacterium]